MKRNLKNSLLTLTFILVLAPAAFAEKWICYDPLATPANDITTVIQGDCLTLGICTGPNNTGIDPNCFEATGGEYNDAQLEYHKVDPVAGQGSRVIEWTAQEIADYLAAQDAAIDASTRGSAISKFDGQTVDGLALRCLVDAIRLRDNQLISRINDLIAGSTPATLNQITLSQVKTTVGSCISNGDADE